MEPKTHTIEQEDKVNITIQASSDGEVIYIEQGGFDFELNSIALEKDRIKTLIALLLQLETE